MFTKKNSNEYYIERLKKLFHIHGDGVATLDLDEAFEDEQFKNTIDMIRNFKIPYKSNN